MADRWDIRLQGGAFDGWEGATDLDPVEVLIAWVCGKHCTGHMTFDAADPGIVLRTAESYRRVEVDVDERLAVYEVGERDPDPVIEDERELVGTAGEITLSPDGTYAPVEAGAIAA